MSGPNLLSQLAELGHSGTANTVLASTSSAANGEQSRSTTTPRGRVGSLTRTGEADSVARVTLEHCIVLFGDVPIELALALRPRDSAVPSPPKRQRAKRSAPDGHTDQQPRKPRVRKAQVPDEELADRVTKLLADYGESMSAATNAPEPPTGSSSQGPKADSPLAETEYECTECNQRWNGDQEPTCRCNADGDDTRSPATPHKGVSK